MKNLSPLFVASLALFLLVAEPALAQSIDLSPIQSLLQGIVDALTGPLRVVIATLAVLGVFLSWFFNIIGRVAQINCNSERALPETEFRRYVQSLGGPVRSSG